MEGKRVRTSTYAHPINGLQLMGENGLTKREWMAAVVAAGLASKLERYGSVEVLTDTAIQIADRIIEKTKE